MGRSFTDRWGSVIFADTDRAVTAFDDAVEQLVSLSGDPATTAKAAVDLDEQLVMGRVLQVYLALYSTGAQGFDTARALLGELDRWSGEGGERERLHLDAARAWADGELEHAADSLERALVHDPRDLLALKVAQDLYFFVGNQRDLRAVVERVVEAWPSNHPGYGYVCGMYAFGLEESGDYGPAEEQAQTALRENSADVWAVHAQAHVFEMKGAQRAGIAFLEATADDWSASYFAVHNWWHQALYHLELKDLERALELYDGPIRSTDSTEWLDLVDAASLLWRLSLFGIDVTDRAKLLAEAIEALLARPVYVFNDWHAVMAAGLAGHLEVCERVVLANRHALGGTNHRAVDGAGLDLLEGFSAFASGDMTRALYRLADIRSKAHIVGGSHAQRDVIDLTLIAVAARLGDTALAEALVEERVARKPSAKDAALELLRANR